MDRRAFLVAGDDQAEHAGIGGDALRGGDETGDRALHVDRAAPVQQVAADLGGEGAAMPALAGRDDVEMAGKAEMAPAVAADRGARGEQVFDRAAVFGIGIVAAVDEAGDGKPRRAQHRFDRVEHRAGRGGDAFGGDQPGGEVDRVGGRGRIHKILVMLRVFHTVRCAFQHR